MPAIAKILKSNGTDGDVLAGLFVDAGEINLQEPVFIEFEGLPVPFFIESLTLKGSTRAVLHLTDVSTLKDAEELVGREIMLEGEDDTGDVSDFTGWTVYDRDRLVGTVTGFEDIPGNPCLCIGEALIPLHEDFVLEVDEQAAILRLDLPEGLL